VERLLKSRSAVSVCLHTQCGTRSRVPEDLDHNEWDALARLVVVLSTLKEGS